MKTIEVLFRCIISLIFLLIVFTFSFAYEDRSSLRLEFNVQKLMQVKNVWALERIPNQPYSQQPLFFSVQENQDTIKTYDLEQVTVYKLIRELIGDDTEIRNVKYTGANNASGYFENGTAAGIGIERGIILTTGDVQNAQGPNDTTSKSTNNQLPGDPQLTALAGYQTYDASILEFEFKPKTSSMSFEYVFASEEYNEFVGSQYNDVFAFFVNDINIALIHGTNDFVSINNVNLNRNSEYYINNDPSNPQHNIQYDGFTKVLTAQANVSQNEWNTIKIAIADTSDRIYDSAVFIKSETFSTSHKITFDDIDDQEINEPFNVKMTVEDQFGAVQTQYSGKIKLQAVPNELFSPLECGIQSGISECELTFLTARKGIQLNASLNYEGDVVSGTSEIFDVNSSWTLSRTLIVQVVDHYHQPIEGAEVSTDLDKKYTDVQGFVKLSYSSSKITVTGKKEGYLPTSKTVYLNFGANGVKLVLTKEGDRYVVLVPGVFGSKSSGVVLPKMPTDYAKSSDLKLFNSPLVWDKVGWKTIKKELEDTWGYTVVEFPYDWRVYPEDFSIPYSGEGVCLSPGDELFHIINKLKEENPNATVDIIAHSLGGILTLTYVKHYGLNNIDRIALVGSPVKGTLNFYPITEYGRTLASDILAKDGISIIYSGNSFFYTRVIDYLYNVKERNNIFKWKSLKHIGTGFFRYHLDCQYVDLCFQPEYNIDPNKIKTWLTNPSNSTLYKIGTPTFQDSLFKNNEETSEVNNYLTRMYDIKHNPQLGLLNKDNFRIFYATNKESVTISQFNRDEFSKYSYENEFQYSVSDIVKKSILGDGLTLKKSADFMNIDGVTISKTVDGDMHSEVIKVFHDEIVDFLVEGRGLIPKSMLLASTQDVDTDNNVLEVSINGFVAPLLSINDQKYGYDIEFDETYLGENLSEFVKQNDYSILTVENFMPGLFSLKITGEVPHDLILNIEGLVNGNGFMLYENVYFHGDPLLIDFYLTSDGELEALNLPVHPAFIETGSYGFENEFTSIFWSEVVGAQSYRIYSKTNKDPRYIFVSEVDGEQTYYDTTDAWGGEVKYYRITSVDTQGNESFLSHQVMNETLKKMDYTVLPSAGEGGSIHPGTPQTVEYGGVAVFTITPEENWYIESVGGTCGGRLDGNTYVTDHIIGHCTVDASFALPNFELLQLLIMDLENSGSLNQGQATALLATLSEAKKHYDEGRMRQANNLLGAFINQVLSFIEEGILDEDEGNSLISQANALISLL